MVKALSQCNTDRLNGFIKIIGMRGHKHYTNLRMSRMSVKGRICKQQIIPTGQVINSFPALNSSSSVRFAQGPTLVHDHFYLSFILMVNQCFALCLKSLTIELKGASEIVPEFLPRTGIKLLPSTNSLHYLNLTITIIEDPVFARPCDGCWYKTQENSYSVVPELSTRHPIVKELT